MTVLKTILIIANDNFDLDKTSLTNDNYNIPLAVTKVEKGDTTQHIQD